MSSPTAHRPEALTSRRGVLVAAMTLATAGFARAADGAPHRAVRFGVWRGGVRIGEHRVGFTGGPMDFDVAIQAHMLVKIGPIPVFRYQHQANESWRDGRFAALRSRSVSNGHVEEVSATWTAGGVAIGRDGRPPSLMAPADAHPLTHWNASVLTGPLFNPQTGAILHEQVSRSVEPLRLGDGTVVRATRYVLHGDAQITDWYDPAGDWVALQAKAPDGSLIDYRLES